MGFESKETVL